MGLREWLTKRLIGSKEEEGKVRYVLKRQKGEGTGMEKVLELVEPTPIEEMYESLEPGLYALHKYSKGRSGFEVVWGPVEVTGEKTQRAPRPEKLLEEAALPRYVEMLRSLAVLKEKASLEYELVKGFFEGGGGGGEKTTEGDILDAIDKLKERYDRMGKLFGAQDIRSNEEAIYEGKVPIWFHPKVIPGLIDDSLEMVEKRLTKWGMIGNEEAPSSGEDLINFPKKPEKKGDE